jgi:hypothetical protein
MVEIFGGWGRIRTWINKRIRIDNSSLFVGENAGKVTTGQHNTFVGAESGLANIAGHSNSFLGFRAGLANISGHSNSFLGYQVGRYNMGYLSGYSNTTGHSNNFMGFMTGYANTTGHSNSFMGLETGVANRDGIANVFLGYKAGYSNVSGNSNVFLGYQAGYYETGSSKLFIDNLHRANEADGRIKALIYGIFDAATANQILRINGILQLPVIKNGATQVGAGAAANEVWKTTGHATLPDNVLMIGV